MTQSTNATTHLQTRIQSLDALRGLAANLVLVTHAGETYASSAREHGHSTWLAQTALSIDIGRIGVILFFLISGFTVANSLRQTGVSIGGFVVKRLFRLYPMFWLSVGIAAVFLRPAAPIDCSATLANLSMLPEVLGFAQLMGIYWTLETEVISYACAGILFAAGRYNSGRFLGTLCAGLVVVFALMMFGVLPSARLLQWQMLPHNLAIILWGSLFQLAFNAPMPLSIALRPSWLSLRVATLLLAVLVLSPSCYALLQYALHGGRDQLRWGVAYPAAFAIFLWTFFHVKNVPRWSVWLGKISYSSYLLHAFVITLLCDLVKESNTLFNWVSLELFVILALLATTALASMSFVVIETPAMKLGKKLERSHRRKLAREPAEEC